MIEELVAYMLGVDCDERWDDLPELFAEKYNVEIDDFEKIVKDLLPLCIESESELTKTVFSGFADKKSGMFLMKAMI